MKWSTVSHKVFLSYFLSTELQYIAELRSFADGLDAVEGTRFMNMCTRHLGGTYGVDPPTFNNTMTEEDMVWQMVYYVLAVMRMKRACDEDLLLLRRKQHDAAEKADRLKLAAWTDRVEAEAKKRLEQEGEQRRFEEAVVKRVAELRVLGPSPN